MMNYEENELELMADTESEYNETETFSGEPVHISTNPNWTRPALPKIDLAKDSVVFHQIHVEHYIGKTGFLERPVIRIFGVTEGGNSVLAHIHGFMPYFYVLAQPGFKEKDCDRFKYALNAAVMRSGKNGIENAVLRVAMEKKESICGFNNNEKIPFLKITMTLPALIAVARRLLERKFECPGYSPHKFQAYESDIDFTLRFMVDCNVVGCNWIEIPPGKYRIRDKVPRDGSSNKSDTLSFCQLEVDVSWEDFISHTTEGDWSKVAPLRILSFHIECAGRKGRFPEPDKDPIIQIANVVMRQGEREPFIRNVFTLDTCGPVFDTQVISCQFENALLKKWAEFLREVDPDIITGYNIQTFDLPYLINRNNHLKISEVNCLGRIEGGECVIEEKIFQSKLTEEKNRAINIEGRVPLDLLQILPDYKLRSNTLNAASYHFLQEQREDIKPSVVADLQNGTDQTRRRLAMKCLKDAFLPLKRLDKLMCVINHIEMARVTGVTLASLLSRGQQFKIVSQLLRKAKEQDLVLPNKIKKTREKYEGALIIEPVKGYYDEPIATLDYSSLYPSIMIVHNLCYTSLLSDSTIKDLDLTSDQYIKTPSGDSFCKTSLRKGLLPVILEHLISARKKAKTDLKMETDPFKKQLLIGRQLALKITANSIYGFTGAQDGYLPCLEIARSVTAFGRKMLQETKECIEEKYTIANGYRFDSKVIYGDTDSVMCKFGFDNVAESMELGKKAAEFISTKFQPPIKLEFEKVYFPYLLIGKKKYAGLYWTNPENYDKLDCKGLEPVRKDTSPLVANLINSCLQFLLIKKDIDGAIGHAKHVISDLFCNRTDISQLVITKELTKASVNGKVKKPHVELAKRMKMRDPGSAPQPGDSVQYVLISALKKTPIHEKSEDPIYVLENNIPIDYEYYFEKQLFAPLLRIFEPIFGEKAKSILLSGDHTRTKVWVPSNVGGLKGSEDRYRCIGCKVLIPDDDAVCNYCKVRESEIFQNQIYQLNALEEKFSRLWTQCQRCQGSLHGDILCTTRDCPIFYMRKKVQKDLVDKDKLMQRFAKGRGEDDGQVGGGV